MLLAHSPLEAPAAGGARGRWAPEGGQGREAPLATMASSYAHAMERQALLPARLDGPAGLDNLQAKKNFSVSHLLDLEEAGDMVAAQAEEGGGEPGRSLLESPGLTSGSDTPQQDSKCGGILSIPSILSILSIPRWCFQPGFPRSPSRPSLPCREPRVPACGNPCFPPAASREKGTAPVGSRAAAPAPCGEPENIPGSRSGLVRSLPGWAENGAWLDGARR